MRALVLFCLFLILPSLHAAEGDTRGLKVIAKDAATQQTAEVPLYGKSYAVIIGIDEYRNLPPDRQLRYAVRDAQGVAATLRRHYKFDRIDTLYDRDATRSRILDLLTDELPAQMGENDALFVFFAGHGDQIKRRDGEVGYLIPHDGQVGKLASVISMADLRDTVSKALPAKHVFYVIDACYGGLLTSTRAVDKAPRRDLAYLQEITRERVRQVLTAGDKGQEVLDGGRNGHSVFTGRLIEALEQAGDFITANEIQAILKERVYGDAHARNHTQTPAYGTLYGSGDYVFIPSLERKAADNQAEIARLEAELQALDAANARAKAARSAAERARLQREADAARRQAEGKLKAEKLKQQQLADEQTRLQTEEAERQQRQVALSEDEKRLAELKAQAQARRKLAASTATADEFPTLDSAVAEIRRLNAQITQIEAGYQQALATSRQRVEERYRTRITALERETKDEFESQSAFAARIAQSRRVATAQRAEELAKLDVQRAAATETDPLKQSIQALSVKQYVLGAERIELKVGGYDADQQRFTVSVGNREAGHAPSILKLAYNGPLTMAPGAARQFKQQWVAGLTAAEVTATPAGGVQKVQLVSEGGRWLYCDHSWLTSKECAVREEETRRKEKWAERYAPVTIPIPGKDYEMGKYEVTQAQWRAVMGGDPPELRFKGCDECPVENVSWDDVQLYLAKLNQMSGRQYRLPTDAEWKYACDGGESHTYCGGEDLDGLGWYDDNSGGKTHPVSQKRANGYGLYDMAGNVWEWMQDCDDGNCSMRVLRGGSWSFNSEFARAAKRIRLSSSFRNLNYGFRVARSARTD